jgi:cation:H+ antiporter
MISSIVLFFLGLITLVAGAELLIRGASRIAEIMRVSSLIIGLTIVAFGTSFPELSVSMQAAFAGSADISIGNVVGSNIFNILFILGISALIVPLIVSVQLIRFDVPIMIASSVILLLMGLDGVIGHIDGLILFSCIILYVTSIVKIEIKKRSDTASSKITEESKPVYLELKNVWLTVTIQIVFIFTGLAILVLGSGWLITAAVEIGRYLGISELIIGLTVVAGGTSLPELATSVLAAIRGQRDIAVGNIVGSNIFNILCILGLTGLIAPAGVSVNPLALAFDIPFMLVVAFSCLPIIFTGQKITRWEGALFFIYYIFYIFELIRSSTGHTETTSLRFVMIWFIFPLTIITIVVSVFRHIKKHGFINQVHSS